MLVFYTSQKLPWCLLMLFVFLVSGRQTTVPGYCVFFMLITADIIKNTNPI